MKRCPECRRDYYDETLLYCLDDGSALLEGPASGEEPTTAILHGTPSESEAATRVQASTVGSKDNATAASDPEYIATKVPRSRVGLALILAVLVVTGLAFAMYWFLAKKPAPFQSIKITKLTNIGNVNAAQISPNGEYVAHVVYENGRNSVRIWDVATKSSVEIIPPTEDDLSVHTFSHDSRYIYFMRRAAGQVATLYQTTVLGGAPKKVLENLDSPISLSPDGSQLTFVRRSLDGTSLVIAKSDGSEEHVLAERSGEERLGTRGPAWSPDGKVIATGISIGSKMTIAAVSAEDGTIKPITSEKWPAVFRVAWLRDGSGLIFSTTDYNSQNQIWYVSYPAGEPRRITDDTNSYGTASISLTADSSTLATFQQNVLSNIFVAPVDDLSHARQVTRNIGGLPSSYIISWTPDGKILYSSTAGGNSDIWIMNADGTGNRQLTNDPAYDGRALATPDGRYIVFDSARLGRQNIWRMNLDGTNLKQLSNGEDDEAPGLSPDGRWVIYDAIANSNLQKVSIDGGEPVRLTEKRVYSPAVSPKDGTIAGLYQVDANSPMRLAIFNAEGGAPLRLFDIPFSSSRDVVWTADGRAVIYLVTRGEASAIWNQPIDGGPPKQLADFNPDRIFSYAVSPDGKQVVFARGNIIRDVVLITDTSK